MKVHYRFDSVSHRFFGLGEKTARKNQHDTSGRGVIGASDGSVIEPLLFLLFINDMPNAITVLTLLFVKIVSRRLLVMIRFSLADQSVSASIPL